jgi:hypothetical protein
MTRRVRSGRPWSVGGGGEWALQAKAVADRIANALGRGLHSSNFRLNVSTFCGIRWVHYFPPVY